MTEDNRTPDLWWSPSEGYWQVSPGWIGFVPLDGSDEFRAYLPDDAVRLVPAPPAPRDGSPLHPGETIREFVQSRTEPGIWYQKQIAERAGITEKHLSQIVQGNVALSAPIAVKIEAATGMSAELLMCLQARYDVDRARDTRADAEWQHTEGMTP